MFGRRRRRKEYGVEEEGNKKDKDSSAIIDTQTKMKKNGNGLMEVKDDKHPTPGDFVMKIDVCRRFGDMCDVDVMRILRDPDEVVVLVFPHECALDLEDGLRLAEGRCGIIHDDNHSNNDEAMPNNECHDGILVPEQKKKMTLVFIDATWKYAKEMEKGTNADGQWPENLIRVQMTPTSSTIGGGGGGRKANVDDSDDGWKTATFIERRFHIRTPPSPDHLSTAESIAWIVSRVEHNPQIYESIMSALDYMVEVWRSCTTSAGDGKDRMSQKRLKISHNS